MNYEPWFTIINQSWHVVVIIQYSACSEGPSFCQILPAQLAASRERPWWEKLVGKMHGVPWCKGNQDWVWRPHGSLHEGCCCRRCGGCCRRQKIDFPCGQMSVAHHNKKDVFQEHWVWHWLSRPTDTLETHHSSWVSSNLLLPLRLSTMLVDFYGSHSLVCSRLCHLGVDPWLSGDLSGDSWRSRGNSGPRYVLDCVVWPLLLFCLELSGVTRTGWLADRAAQVDGSRQDQWLTMRMKCWFFMKPHGGCHSVFSMTRINHEPST